MSRFDGPEPLDAKHDVDGFDCGVESLNVWLMRHARSSAGPGSAKTYVVIDTDRDHVVGYHALTVASIEHEDAAERVRRGMPQHQITAVLLARLAVDKSVQEIGMGAFLLADAMKRALSVAETAGIRLLLAHAVDTKALEFYLRFGFEISPTDPLNVQLILKDVRRSLDQSVQSPGG